MTLRQECIAVRLHQRKCIHARRAVCDHRSSCCAIKRTDCALAHLVSMASGGVFTDGVGWCVGRQRAAVSADAYRWSGTPATRHRL